MISWEVKITKKNYFTSFSSMTTSSKQDNQSTTTTRKKTQTSTLTFDATSKVVTYNQILPKVK